MGFLFLDIETYVDLKNSNSSLNPFEKESKIIVISYNYYDAFSMEEGILKKPTFLKEWESSEKEILEKFLTELKEISKRDRYLKIVGFNVMGFDVPYIFCRLLKHKLIYESEAYDLLFRKPFFLDLAQLSCPVSPLTIKHGEFFSTNQKEVNKFFNISVKEGTGVDVSDFYRNKQFDKIMEYVEKEFTFEQLHLCLKDHHINK